MDDMELLLAEAGSFADVIADLERVSETGTADDAKEVVHEALRLSEEMMTRLEEALDITESDSERSRIEMAITALEDAQDYGHLALTSVDSTIDVDNMRVKMEEAVSYLLAFEEVEE